MSDARSVSQRRARYPFDALVDAYDAYRLGYSDEVFEAIESAGVAAKARLLDVGCGTGISAKPFVEAGAQVTGLDIAPQMLGRARAHLPGAVFDLGAAEEMPYADDSFDAAISAQSFHWFDASLALAEMARVVRPGGVVAVWWKTVMRGDAIRIFRAQAARTIGFTLDEPLLGEAFPEFDEDLLENQRLRVIPWLVTIDVAHFLGYERSRARANAFYGDRMETYLAALGAILGAPQTRYEITFVQYLYLATVPLRKPA